MISERTYITLRWIGLGLIPTLAVICFLISGIIDIPYVKEILGCFAIIELLIGIIIKTVRIRYIYDGIMFVNLSDPEKDVYRMELNDPLESIHNKEKIIFKVELIEE